MTSETPRKRHIVLSVASAAAAIQAIGDIRAQSGMLDLPARSEHAAATEAASRAPVQVEIRRHLPAIIEGVRIKGVALTDSYAEVAQAYLDDSSRITGGSDLTWSTCYSNCHSACHGSRSWR